jgi:decaprenylphospho-beta-D-ribofuranose 2-oxidase
VLTTSRTTSTTGEWQSLSGWGRSPSTSSQVVRPSNLADLADVVTDGGKHIARGMGRSYGDAAQLAGGTVVDMTAIQGVDLDSDTGMVTAMAGTSIGEILNVTVPQGWFLPVTPGTRHVTLGGAIAADVHGKNHHRDGSFGAHIESLQMLIHDGRIVEMRPGSESFSATLGGMGLTGVIIEATFRLIPVESAAMSVHTVATPDLPTTMQSLLESDTDFRYTVAWTDLSDLRGRGLVMSADHASADEVPGRRREPDGGSHAISLPDWFPGVVNKVTVNVFNRLWYTLGHRRTGRRIESLDSFFYPLDRVGAWNRLYGQKGFLQYQFVVPHDSEGTLLEIAGILSRMATPVSLAVLKRMGDASTGHLSFPMPGWTLAVDMPLGDTDLGRILDECDSKVADAGGRVYLAKDSRLRHQLVEEMYPNAATWREAQSRLDPEGRMRSNLSLRLGLTD